MRGRLLTVPIKYCPHALTARHEGRYWCIHCGRDLYTLMPKAYLIEPLVRFDEGRGWVLSMYVGELIIAQPRSDSGKIR